MIGSILRTMKAYDPEADPAVVREREMIDALRDHAEALRSHGAPPLAPRTAKERAQDAPLTELDLAAADRVARRFGLRFKRGAR